MVTTAGQLSWNRLSDDKRKAVIDMYRTKRFGATTVAKSLGLGSTTVYRILEEAGIVRDRDCLRKGRLGLGRFDDDVSREIAAKYATGTALQALAKEYNCTNGPIRRAVKLFGDGLRRRGAEVRDFTPEEVSIMEAMWKAGASLTTIGKKYAAHQVIISRALRQQGIDVRYRQLRLETHPSWKGGTSVISGGYVSVVMPPNSPLCAMMGSNGRVLEHRLVMAKALGRLLRPDETIHHINGDKQDNRLANLELRQGKHGKHIVFCCADCGSRNVFPVTLAGLT